MLTKEDKILQRKITDILLNYNISWWQLCDGYSYLIDDDTNFELLKKDNKTWVKRFFEIFRCSKEDVLNNDKKLNEIFETYPFFNEYNMYDFYLNILKTGGPSKTLSVIFNSKYEPIYDSEVVLKKLSLIMKLTADFVPEIKQDVSQIKNLKIDYSVFGNYDNLNTLFKLYNEVVVNYEKIFHKILNGNATESEKVFFDVISVVLKAVDVLDESFKFSVRFVEQNRLMLKEELSVGKTVFYRFLNMITPWYFEEFYNNEQLIHKFLETYPGAKAEMLKFLNEIMYIDCNYSIKKDSPILIEAQENTNTQNNNVIDFLKENNKNFNPIKINYIFDKFIVKNNKKFAVYKKSYSVKVEKWETFETKKEYEIVKNLRQMLSIPELGGFNVPTNLISRSEIEKRKKFRNEFQKGGTNNGVK